MAQLIYHFAPVPRSMAAALKAPCGTRNPVLRTDDFEMVTCKRCLAKIVPGMLRRAKKEQRTLRFEHADINRVRRWVDRLGFSYDATLGYQLRDADGQRWLATIVHQDGAYHGAAFPSETT